MHKFKLTWKDGTVTEITGDYISNTLERAGYTIKQLKHLRKWEIV
jgi:hypothetical protein